MFQIIGVRLYLKISSQSYCVPTTVFTVSIHELRNEQPKVKTEFAKKCLADFIFFLRP